MNAAATSLVGDTRPLGRRLWDVFPTLAGTAVEDNFRRAMAERIPISFEHYFHSDLTEASFEFHVHPQAGEGLVVYLRNTTEARKAEQALRRSEQLAAAGRLAASVAHEINNPLEALTNLLFLAKLDPDLGGNTKDMLEKADRELQRLSHIAARSLRFYRQRTAPAPTSLEELVETVLFFNAPDLRSRAIVAARRYRPAPPVVCLPGEVQQVITNLIRNSIDAMQSGGRLVVRVRPANAAAGRDGVLVTIADTGSGMDRNTMSRIFQPFVTTKGDSGTGLGLWVSKTILENHQATIKLRSRESCGTVFRVFFPFNAGEPKSAASQHN
jgi:signal transduction histidine kinase